MFDDVIEKQKLLMEKVPHEVRPESAVKMAAGLKVIDALLRYLNSTGHKPWRPNPLPKEDQDRVITELWQRVQVLTNIHHFPDDHEYPDIIETLKRQVISSYGIIEETIEYINSVGTGSRGEQLEELTDILFFYAEQVILSGFTPEQIEAEYHRKWDVNMERYRRAKEGDYGWDKRGEDKL